MISEGCGQDIVTSSSTIPPSSGSEVVEESGTEMKIA